jgi:hypothetical protein
MALKFRRCRARVNGRAKSGFARTERAPYSRLKFDTLGYRNVAVNGRDGYLAKALECVREVERLRDAGERKKLLQIAGLYMSLARRLADRHERGTACRCPEHRHCPEDA